MGGGRRKGLREGKEGRESNGGRMRENSMRGRDGGKERQIEREMDNTYFSCRSRYC